MKNYGEGIVNRFGDINDQTMDRWHAIGEETLNLDCPNSPHLKAELTRCEDILDIVFQDVIENQTKYQTKSGSFATYMVWATVYAVEWAYDNGYDISDYAQFFDQLYTIDRKLANDDEMRYNQAHLDWLALPNALEANEPKKSHYYGHWATVHKSSIMRTKRIKRLTDEISKPENLKKLKMVKQAAAAAK